MEDADLFATLIAAEAGGEPYIGKVAVARVVRNRMRARYFSDGTVAGTALWRFQFSEFWFSYRKQDHKYAQDAFSPAQAAAKAETMATQFRQQSIWVACQKAVTDSADAAFDGGPQFAKIGPRTLLYLNPKIIPNRPAWATPDTLACVIGNHEFHNAPVRGK